MEDFRHLSRIADIHGRRGQAPEDLPPAPFLAYLNLRRVLLSLTVVLLGMAAWWGL